MPCSRKCQECVHRGLYMLRPDFPSTRASASLPYTARLASVSVGSATSTANLWHPLAWPTRRRDTRVNHVARLPIAHDQVDVGQNRSTPNWGERPTAAATWQQLCDVPAASIAASRLRKNERRLVSAVAASIIENTTDAQYYITLFYSYEFLLVCIAQLLGIINIDIHIQQYIGPSPLRM